jgi:DNA polymerase III epsilon subunit-like protein
MLKENFHVNSLDWSWLMNTCDLQQIFNRQTDGANKQRSLEYAMEYFGLTQELPAHDALNDAYFTAMVAQSLDVPKGVATYNEIRGEYILSDVIGDADAGDDGYVTIGEMLDDEIVKSPLCPVCGEQLCQKERTLHSKGQRYTLWFNCKKDGDMLMVLKVHRNFNETWRAKRTVQEASAEQLDKFRQELKQRAAIRKKTRSRKPRPPRRTRDSES